MKRTLNLASVLATMLTGSIAFAGGHHLPGYEAYFDAPRTAARPLSNVALLPDVLAGVANVDEMRGVPTMFWAPANGVMVPAAILQQPRAAAKFYLEHYAALYGLGSGALASAHVDMVHDTGRGGIVVVFRQKAAGVDVHLIAAKVLMTRDLRLVAISGNLHPLAGSSTTRFAKFVQTPRDAIARSFNDFYGTKVPASAFVDTKNPEHGYSFYAMNDTDETLARDIGLARPARVKKVYYPLPETLVPAYYVEIAGAKKSSTSSVLYSYVIAADDGRMLKRMSLTQDAAFTYRVWSDGAPNFTPMDGPQADYTPHPTGTPDGSSPAFVMPTLVTVDGFNKNPMNTFDPWLAAGATQTLGNNVDAYVDRNAPDGFGGQDFRATTTMAGVFDRIYNTAQSPTVNQNQQRAAITQLFYNNNYYHDYWYDSGFDEAAGNAQSNNFGRGGAGNDPILAEGQDFSGTDNANMQTPADGSSPIMQMYIFSGVQNQSLQRDGTIDGGIIGHEWGHYLHQRLSSPGTQQGRAMGEGWGDFQALMQLVHPNDNTGASFSGVFATGIYASATFGDSAYYGIRRVPYSKDMTKNGLTFKHIGDSATLPPGMLDFANNAEVHNAGEVWCQMLWEGYSNMLDDTLGAGARHTFDQAKRKMADYVVAGLKLAPPNMTFTEQRDGILTAAVAAGRISGDFSDFQDLASGFAKRGAGRCARSPTRNSMTLDGVVESFTTNPEPVFVSAFFEDTLPACDHDGVLDAGETGRIAITVQNIGWANLMGATVSVTSGDPNLTFPNGNMATIPTTAVFDNGVAYVDVKLANTVNMTSVVPFNIVINAADACQSTVNASGSAEVHFDSAEPNTANAATTETFEGLTKTWAAKLPSGGATQLWNIMRPNANGANELIWGQDIAGISDHRYESPDLMVGAGPFSMTFQNRYEFERSQNTNWDGAVIEYSDDAGATWKDVNTLAGVNPGYNGAIDNSAGNPLGGRQGYTGATNGFANGTMVARTIDFGTTLANKTIKLRFRIGTDEVQDAGGWYIDDIAFTGLTNQPFSAQLAEDGMCENLPPVANAGMDQTVPSNASVKLDGSASTDPDMAPNPLTYAWTQTAGPTVMLTGGTSAAPNFVAPSVMADTTLTFQLTVNDGAAMASDSVDILVQKGAGDGSTGGMGGMGEGGAGGSTSDPGGCDCSLPGAEHSNSTRDVGGFLSALFGAWLVRRRRQNRLS